MNIDEQDIKDKKLLHGDITQRIIACAFEVINELGNGFLESVYENALMVALSDAGLLVEHQKAIQVIFRNQTVGDFYADMLVERKVLIELKTVKNILPRHQAQVIHYLNATGLQVGLLINFGKSKLEFNRLTRDRKPSNSCPSM